MKRMPYSLYKQYYRQFPSEDYDPKTKTISVDVPEERRKTFPKSWKRDANHYFTPGGCEVLFWGSGLAENFVVRKYVSSYDIKSKTICPGIDARDRAIECVAQFESNQNQAETGASPSP